MIPLMGQVLGIILRGDLAKGHVAALNYNHKGMKPLI